MVYLTPEQRDKLNALNAERQEKALQEGRLVEGPQGPASTELNTSGPLENAHGKTNSLSYHFPDNGWLISNILWALVSWVELSVPVAGNPWFLGKSRWGRLGVVGKVTPH